MQSNNILLNWVLLISTFLIAGKAFKLIDVSWVVAFLPVITIVVAGVIAFLIGLALANKITKDEQNR